MVIQREDTPESKINEKKSDINQSIMFRKCQFLHLANLRLETASEIFLNIIHPDKRVCKILETVPQAITPCHPLSNCFMDSWAVKQNLKENDLTELFSPQIMKEKPSYTIFTNNDAKATAQPCPRCIAGESGHFGHMMGL